MTERNVTGVDREQVRRDAEIASKADSLDISAWARQWLALLAELEQAERERDELRALANCYRDALNVK